MAAEKDHISLRSIPDLVEAHEWLFNKQQAGAIDAKTADAMNTTLKGSSYLQGKLRLDAAKLFITSRVKKIEFPPGLLPALAESIKEK
jgi:hypothetical protein